MGQNESTTSSNSSRSLSNQSFQHRTIQNFRLIWLDGSVDEIRNKDSREALKKIRQIVHRVDIFNDMDECIDFIKETQEENILFIISGTLGQATVPIIHYRSQITTIFIYCENKTRHEQWTQRWTKIRGVYADMTSLLDGLKQAALDFDQNSIPISFLAPIEETTYINLCVLDQFFMYMLTIKDIILTSEYQRTHLDDFIRYCQERLAGNILVSENMKKLHEKYNQQQAIWWYTSQFIIYSMLNKALYSREYDILFRMGFLIHDLHKQISTLHSEQYNEENADQTLIVYHSQGLTDRDFNQLLNTKNGLLSFNNFLLTNKSPNKSLEFIQRTIRTTNLKGVMFIIKLNPSQTSIPFANIRHVSAHGKDDEIFLSFHSIFRIGDAKQIDENDRMWQVELTFVNDDDSQLQRVIERMHEETKGPVGWIRLIKLMIKFEDFDKAEQMCNLLHTDTAADREKADLYYYLGLILMQRGEFEKSLPIHEKALELREKVHTTFHHDVADSYNDIAVQYNQMGDPNKALTYYQKALEIFLKSVPESDPDLHICYDNLGMVCLNMDKCPEALEFLQKSLELRQKTLPENHLDFTHSYRLIAEVYVYMSQYKEALVLHEKALELRQKVLPANHRDFAISYTYIGGVYMKLRDYPKALAYYEKAKIIYEKNLPPNHPSVAMAYSYMGDVYNCMRQYAKALSFYEKTLEIRREVLPDNHRETAITYNDLGDVYQSTREYSKALASYERCLNILKYVLPEDHHVIQNLKKNIENMKKKL